MPSNAKLNAIKSKRRKGKKMSKLPNSTNTVTDVNTTQINKANEMWKDLKNRVKSNPKFAELPDSKKIEIYQKSEFKEFYTNFPIVSRYMICMGQFSVNAFRRFLKEDSNNATNSARGTKKQVYHRKT